jgi:hypothetical protein
LEERKWIPMGIVFAFKSWKENWLESEDF